MAKLNSNSVPEHRITPATHMMISFGWGNKYILPIEDALALQRIMAGAIRIVSACSLPDNNDLWVRSNNTIDAAPSYILSGDEYALDHTESSGDVIAYAAMFNATRDLGGNEAVADLTFAKFLAEQPQTK